MMGWVQLCLLCWDTAADDWGGVGCLRLGRVDRTVEGHYPNSKPFHMEGKIINLKRTFLFKKSICDYILPFILFKHE